MAFIGALLIVFGAICIGLSQQKAPDLGLRRSLGLFACYSGNILYHHSVTMVGNYEICHRNYITRFNNNLELNGGILRLQSIY